MAIAPVAEDLLKLLSPSARAALRAELESNENARKMVEEGLTFRDAYLNGTDDPTISGGNGDDEAARKAEADRKAAEKAEADRKAAAAAAAANGNGGNGNGNGGNAELRALMDQLTGLKTSLDEKLKNVVTKGDLPKLGEELLGRAIKNAHLVARIERQHEKEFGEELNLDELNAYLQEQVKTGRSFKDMQEVYDSKMGEKRTQKKIADGIAEGLKQKRSADAVPGQSSPAGGSSAQEAIRKARGESGGNVNDYVEKLKKIRENREGVGEAA